MKVKKVSLKIIIIIVITECIILGCVFGIVKSNLNNVKNNIDSNNDKILLENEIIKNANNELNLVIISSVGVIVIFAIISYGYLSKMVIYPKK